MWKARLSAARARCGLHARRPGNRLRPGSEPDRTIGLNPKWACRDCLAMPIVNGARLFCLAQTLSSVNGVCALARRADHRTSGAPIAVVDPPEWHGRFHFGIFADRMKAGTAQRAALNALSTLVMIVSGAFHEGLMVDVQAINAKLQRREAEHILNSVDRPHTAGGSRRARASERQRKACRPAVARLQRGRSHQRARSRWRPIADGAEGSWRSAPAH